MKEGDKKITQDGGKCKSPTNTIKIQDSILLRRAIQDKNRESIRQLNTLYYPNVKRYIASRIDTIEDVEDMTQAVFLEFYKKDNGYEEYHSIEAYLLKIAQNLVALHYRSQNRQIKTIPIDSVDEIGTSEKVSQYKVSKENLLSQEYKIVQALINQLPPKTQEAMRLRFLEGLSPKDAAKKAGCSANAFYQRIIVGIKAIKKLKNKNSPTRQKRYQQKK